jgi:nanoRNase/pAp phosphatase (c-di-AMP/oligoRNAs hydrolase)
MIRHATRRRFGLLAKVVEGTEASRRWLVLTHDNPDPDALASASLLAALLAQRFDRRVTCAYSGLIGRAENREMVRTLRLKIKPLRRLNLARYTYFALVDTQPRTGNNQLPDGVVPELVFDHHPPRRWSSTAAFADIRPDYGATATILAEYHKVAGLIVSPPCATAVVYAIRSETQDFGREYAPIDKAIYDECLADVDKRALGRIQSAPLPLSYFHSLRQALGALESVGSLVISHIERIDQPDIVPEVADLLLRLEGKTWAMCTGRLDDRIYLSIRTSNPRADAGTLMRALVGKSGKGGGHGRTAGGWVTITPGYAADPPALQRQLARRLASRLQKDPDKIEPLVTEGDQG